jgi:hypothetical protein
VDDNILDQRILQSSIILDPVKDRPMPHQTILPVQNPMALIREMQEPRRDTKRLEDVEKTQALSDGQTEIQIVVDDELGRAEVLGVVDGIPFLVVVTVVPDGAVLVLLDEPDFVGAVGTDLVEFAVVRDDGFEFAAELVALDPVHPEQSLVVQYRQGATGTYMKPP